MQITRITLRELRNDEHFQFMTDVRDLLKETIASDKLNIEELFTAFLSALQKEDDSFKVFLKSQFTQEITDADAARDKIFRGLTLLVQAYKRTLNPSYTQAASNIEFVLDNYGDIRKKSFNEQTALTYNLLEDLNKRCQKDIEQINAKDFIADLSKSNELVAKLMSNRFDENAAKPETNLFDIRFEVDAIYRQIVERIEALIVINGASKYANFISRLNERIAYYRNTIAIRQGHAAKKGEEKISTDK